MPLAHCPCPLGACGARSAPRSTLVATKGTTLFIAAALTANAAVVAVVASSMFRLGQARGTAAVAIVPLARAANAPVDPRTWASLKTGDLRSLAGRLRAAGFPAKLVRTIVQAQIDEQFRPRREALVAHLSAAPFWDVHFNNMDPKFMADLNAISREEAKAIKEILGPDASPPDPIGNMMTQNQRGSVPPEKYARVQAILNDYNEMRNEVTSGTNGVFLPEDQEKLGYLGKQQQADLEGVLTPDEMLEYKLRNGQNASMLRYALQGFNPTEDEFRSIFKAQDDFDRQYGSNNGPLTQEQVKARQDHQADLDAQIQDALGSDRYAEYKRDTAPGYVELSKFVERLGLPSSTTEQVTAVKDDFSRRVDAIRKDQSLSPPDRASQLAALLDESSGKLSEVMGDQAFADYKQTQGWWLRVPKK
jgi:hypothetical protein